MPDVQIVAPLHYRDGRTREATTWRISWHDDGSLNRGRTSDGLLPDRVQIEHNSRNRSGVELALARRVHDLEEAMRGREANACTGDVEMGLFRVDGVNFVTTIDGAEFFNSVSTSRGTPLPVAEELFNALTSAAFQIRALRTRVAELQGEANRAPAIQPVDVLPPHPSSSSDMADWERELLGAAAMTPVLQPRVGDSLTEESRESLPVGSTVQYHAAGSGPALALFPRNDWYTRIAHGWAYQGGNGRQQRMDREAFENGRYYITGIPDTQPASPRVGDVVTLSTVNTLPVGTMIHFSYEFDAPQWLTAQRNHRDGNRDCHIMSEDGWRYQADDGRLAGPDRRQVERGHWFITELPATSAVTVDDILADLPGYRGE